MPVIPDAEPIFSLAVATQIDAAGLLTFSDRQRLLRLGKLLGLERFDANLLIARVQNRAELTRKHRQPPCRCRARKSVLCALTVQCVILIGAWWGLMG
jgi:hypothetical protein